MKIFRLVLVVTTLVLVGRHAIAAKPLKLASPNGQLVVTLSLDNQLTISASLAGQEVLLPTELSLTLEGGKVLGLKPSVDRKVERSINTVAKGNFYRKAVVPNVCNELEVFLADGSGLIIRAYDNGMAYRWVTRQKGRIKVLSEQADFSFPATAAAYLANSKNKDLFCSFENTYDSVAISRIDTAKVYITPALFAIGNAKVLVSESDLNDYPGLNLVVNKAKPGGFKTRFAPVVTSIKGIVNGKPEYDMSRPTGRAAHIAETDGDRHFPWRVLGITTNDADLADFDLVYLLARPSQIEDMSWIKPGKAAWDWWSSWDFKGVDFKAGKNTATYKAYIDFAAANRLEYVVLDEGWSPALNTVLKVIPEINLSELVAYGKQKNVGIWLWATGYAIDNEMKEAFATYSAMGIKGFKIDFMDRDDQYMVNFLERCAKEAASYKLMVDYHGIFKPTGLNRTWPNEVNREGIFGNENNKWTNTLTTKQQLLLPFTRLAAGHADFTPGAMRNMNGRDFKPLYNHPMSQGTRCHQLAMYVLYDGPLQMLCDAPHLYTADPKVLAYLQEVPTTWDETKVLKAELGKVLVVAKRKGETWYVAGMNHPSQSLELAMDFLPRGQFDVSLYQDGLNADINAEDYKHAASTINRKETLKVSMAAGGGFIAVLKAQ